MEVAAALPLLTMLLSRELALAKTLLMRLEMLLWSDGAAVAATDERLEATEAASEATEAASEVR
jgi:hypothetical protein